MLFSILVAHYSNSEFLKQSLYSVYQQTYRSREVILVDDGSKDDFVKVISEYETDSRIKEYRNKNNRGCAFTKRICVEKVSGTIAGFLDPVDKLHPDALEIMVNAHIEKPGHSIIHSTHFICDEKLTVKREAGYQRALTKNTPYLLLGDGSIHHFATFKMSCYKRTDGISAVRKKNKAIDQDLYYLLEEEGDVFYINRPLYYYRIHKGGISTLDNKSLAALAHFAIIEEACLRRIVKLKLSKEPGAANWVKKYNTRYHKIHIFNSFRHRHWGAFIKSLLIFPFVGGMENAVNYIKKLLKEGVSLLRKSFVQS